MPLLNKETFHPNEPPPDLKESEEVFFCRLTREIFRDYEQFCERIILCNSLVWSCGLTGRSHLTYQEASASEEKIKRLLKRFPMELRIPVLYLACLCERKSLVELAEDVFTFVKDRYFIGETVQVNFSVGKGDKNEYCPCHILAIIPPSKDDIDKFTQQNQRNGERFPWIPASLYRYEIERLDNGEEIEVKADQISRKKSSYTKDKNRLYIKQFFHAENGIWKIKESSNSKYGISKVKFEQIFCGSPPDMNTKKQSTPSNKKGNSKRQETLNKYFKSSEKRIGLSPRKSPKKSGDLMDRRGSHSAKRKRRTKKEMEEAVKTGVRGIPPSVEAKRRAREEKKEKKKNLADFLREWSMKREDLECEDLKELPTPALVQSQLKNELFGEAVMLMEFLHCVRSILPVKDFFPHGVTFDLIERALVENEVTGPLSDLLQLLLTSIFDLQEQESEEIKETDVKMNPGLIFTRGDADTIKVVKAATASDAWARKHHSIPVSQLSLDPSTISEVLRLHLLTSGAIPSKSKVAKWRYQARGGYCNNDDPAVVLKLERPQLIEKLGQTSFFEFSTEERISVLNCLVEQIITYSSLRDIFEEGCDRARSARIELRSVKAAEVRKEKEEALRLKAEKKTGIISDDKKVLKENRELRSLNSEKRDFTDLLVDIRQALAYAQLVPLGTDSAHRRYWIFSSVPGLFVEEGEQHSGPCIPNGTPCFPASNSGNEDHLAYIRRLFEESSKDKENFPGRSPPPRPPSPRRHLLVEKNSSEDSSLLNGDKKELRGRTGLICSGNEETCPVHGENRRTVWSYFSEPAQIEQLIEGLNRRGIREKRLKQTLTQEKNTILERLSSCPADKFNNVLPNSSKLFTELQNKSMKQYDQANSGHSSDTTVDLILERNLRELILEVEEKIFLGVVGGIKIKNRDTWREAISSFSYDQQCKKLFWGSKNSDDGDSSRTIKEEHGDEEIKKEEIDEESRASTPSIDESSSQTSSAWPGIGEVPQRPVIADMASAILQLGQGIEAKYLKRPLGLDPKEKEEKTLKNIEAKIPTYAMERWEEALMAATSFPQLFVFLSALDNSVLWERSALHTSCRICRRKKDPEQMLLCDTCNKGHHLYCLKPKLTKVPAGDWHCPKCKPKEKQVSPLKKRRLFSEDSDCEENVEEYECKSCGEKGAQLGCGTCDTRLHLGCVIPPMRRVPKSKWFCHDCRNANLQNSLANSRKTNGSAEVKVEVKEEDEEVLAKQEAVSSSSKAKNIEGGKKTRDKNLAITTSPKLKTNGYVNGMKKQDYLEEEQSEERLSRRKCSKAATAKISQFAKQLRSNNWDDDSDSEEEEEEELSTPSSSRSRRDRRSSRRSDGRKARDLPLDNAALQEILDILMHDPDAPPFLRPVARSEAPDYHDIVKKPMDFGTIKHKLNMLSYQKNSDLITDAELLFNNCCLYNEEDTEVYMAGEKLRQIFYKLCKEHNLLDSDDAREPPLKKSRNDRSSRGKR